MFCCSVICLFVFLFVFLSMFIACPSQYFRLSLRLHIPCFRFSLPQRLAVLPVVNLLHLGQWVVFSVNGGCINRFCILSSIYWRHIASVLVLKAGVCLLLFCDLSIGCFSVVISWYLVFLSSAREHHWREYLSGSGILMHYGMPLGRCGSDQGRQSVAVFS